ncbi:hypothetical protein ACLB2K_071217 [Fragaria x ananassa]
MYEDQVLFTQKLKKELGLDTSRIFRYRNNRKPSAEVDYAPGNNYKFTMMMLVDFERQVPGLETRSYLNLMDWGMHNNVIAIGVGKRLWFAHIDREKTPPHVGPSYGDDEFVNGVSWSPEGDDVLAVGLKNSQVHLLDPIISQKIRTFGSCGVGSLAWNGRVLTAGNLDGHIVNYDVRVGTQVSRLPESHQGAICGLKWSASGQLLASGGSDNVVHVWDGRVPTRWLHKLEEHNAAVRAVAWNPLKRHLLASDGGEGDHYIRLWDASSGTPHENASVDTGSEVCGLFWSKDHVDTLFSTHGFGGSLSVRDNRLILWRPPMMFKIDEMYIESDDDVPAPPPRASFFSAQSPVGYNVAIAGD